MRKAEAIVWETGAHTASRNAIIIYNPDPFYNLDEQVCKAFATTLSNSNWYAQVLTVKAIEESNLAQADLIVFCTNTYNWAPDTATMDFLKTQNLDGMKCVALTLGMGTTDRAQRILEETIESRGGELLGSKAYWLGKPNAEPGVVAPNVHIAKLLVAEFADEILKSF
ncbi:flavodoxin family protein [Dokdonia sinensis]|nr:hypothetical protein [Dokdonia sinensis]